MADSVATGGEAAFDGGAALAALPREVQGVLWRLVPVTERLRSREVCRGWRAALHDPVAWGELDLSAATLGRAATLALLRAACAAVSAGALCELDLRGQPLRADDGDLYEELLAVARLNAGSLRALRLSAPPLQQHNHTYSLPAPVAEALLLAAPSLRTLECQLLVSDDDLRHAQPLLLHAGPLHVSSLVVDSFRALAMQQDAVVAVLAAAGGHAPLRALSLLGGRAPLLPRVAEAFADAALAARVEHLALHDCALSADGVQHLARAAASPALRALDWKLSGMPLSGGDLEPLAASLAASTSLDSLRLCPSYDPHAAGASLLRALVGHPTLARLELDAGAIAAGSLHNAQRYATALGRLVEADAPALACIELSTQTRRNRLKDSDVLRPLFQGLHRTHHLRQLSISWCAVGEDFARAVVLPAVRLNESLRVLRMSFVVGDPPPSMQAAMDWVARQEAQ